MKSFILLFILNFAYAAPDDSFEARISKKINLSGHKCYGGEVTVAVMNGQWSDYLCTPNEWFISIDELFFTAKLKESLTKKSDYFTYYNIVSTIPVSPQTKWVLKRYQLRVSLNGELNIVQK